MEKQSVIDWYINIRGKRNSSFVVFDNDNFYPSISLDFFNNTIKFASEKCTISGNELSIIMQSRQTLLFHGKQPWRDWNFWTSWMLYLKTTKHCHEKGTSWIIPRWRSWYYEKMSGAEIEWKRKQIIKIFKDCGLKITIKTNLTSVHFFDIRLNLSTVQETQQRANIHQQKPKPP